MLFACMTSKGCALLAPWILVSWHAGAVEDGDVPDAVLPWRSGAVREQNLRSRCWVALQWQHDPPIGLF